MITHKGETAFEHEVFEQIEFRCQNRYLTETDEDKQWYVTETDG
jgi:hypothetical protein